MKKIISLILLLTPSVFASGKFIFDFRTDYQSQSPNDEGKIQGLNSNSKIYIKTARLDYSGALNEFTTYRGRMLLNAAQASVASRDSMGNAVELFYISHKFRPQFDLTVGKIVSDMGGKEQTIASPDQYFNTAANAGVPTELNSLTRTNYQAKTGTAISSFSWANMAIVKYYTAAKMTYKNQDAEMALHIANLPSDDPATGSLNQSRLMTGLVGKSSYLDKTLNLHVSYHDSYLPSAASIDAKATYLSVGVRYLLNDRQFDLDMLKNSFKERTLTTGEDSIQSTVFAWSKPFDQWTAKLKYEFSQAAVVGEKMFDINTVGAAAEWAPAKEESFRYHLAYNMKTYKPSTGDSIASNEVILGLRLAADLLK